MKEHPTTLPFPSLDTDKMWTPCSLFSTLCVLSKPPFCQQKEVRSPLRSPAQVDGTQGFLPQPGKDLERPSSTRLEARVPSHGSGAMTRSPSPLAWRPDFPGLYSTTMPLLFIRKLSPSWDSSDHTQNLNKDWSVAAFLNRCITPLPMPLEIQISSWKA